jgi:hypothetical protein
MVTADETQRKLARKVLAVMVHLVKDPSLFSRMKTLVGPVETLAEQARGPVEQAFTQALREVLEEELKIAAATSYDLGAVEACALLGVEPFQRPKRRR